MPYETDDLTSGDALGLHYPTCPAEIAKREAQAAHDADHAAAIERERVAAWFEGKVINECREPFHSGNDGEILTVRIFIPRDQVACAHSLLAAIRNGAHNEAP